LAPKDKIGGLFPKKLGALTLQPHEQFSEEKKETLGDEQLSFK